MKFVIAAVSGVIAAAAASPVPVMSRDPANLLDDTTLHSCVSGERDSVANGVVTVRLNETLCVRMETRGARLIPLTLATSADAEDVLLIRLVRTPLPAGSWILVSNPYRSRLQFESRFTFGGRRGVPVHARTCPVPAGALGGDLWWSDLREVKLDNFSLVPDANGLQCDPDKVLLPESRAAG